LSKVSCLIQSSLCCRSWWCECPLHEEDRWSLFRAKYQWLVICFPWGDFENSARPLPPPIDGCGRYFFWTKEIKSPFWKEMLVFVICLCITGVTVMRRRQNGQLFFCASFSHIHTMCLLSLFYTWNEWSSKGKSFLTYLSSFLQCWK